MKLLAITTLIRDINRDMTNIGGYQWMKNSRHIFALYGKRFIRIVNLV